MTIEARPTSFTPFPRHWTSLLFTLCALVAISILLASIHNPCTGASTDSDSLSSNAAAASRREAFVTVIYGTEYGLPARVMFQSLKESGTNRDLVILVTPDVPDYVCKMLENMGVRIIRTDSIHNPYSGYESRFSQVLSKLNIFNMTQYDKIVYIDADALVFENVDGLFECGSFCAAFINPCLFNSGVMVVEPASFVYQDMVQKLPLLKSYDGGDQGFLNEYFADLYAATLFDPSNPRSVRPPQLQNQLAHRKSANIEEYRARIFRLPFNYHVDHTFWYRKFDWGPPCMRAKIVEFLGVSAIKPWYWWSYPITTLSWLWLEYRDRLPRPPLSVPVNDELLRSPFLMAASLLPPIVLVLSVLAWKQRSCRCISPSARNSSSSSNNNNNVTSAVTPSVETGLSLFSRIGDMLFNTATTISSMIPSGLITPGRLPYLSVLVALLAAYAGVNVGLFVTPYSARPYLGWTLFIEWTLFCIIGLGALFCYLCYSQGALSSQPLVVKASLSLSSSSSGSFSSSVFGKACEWISRLGPIQWTFFWTMLPVVVAILFLYSNMIALFNNIGAKLVYLGFGGLNLAYFYIFCMYKISSLWFHHGAASNGARKRQHQSEKEISSSYDDECPDDEHSSDCQDVVVENTRRENDNHSFIIFSHNEQSSGIGERA